MAELLMDQNFETLPEDVKWESSKAIHVYNAYTPLDHAPSRKLALAKIMITKLTEDVKTLSAGTSKDIDMHSEWRDVKKRLTEETMQRYIADENCDRMKGEMDKLMKELEAEKQKMKVVLAGSSVEDAGKEKSLREVIVELERKVKDELQPSKDALEQLIKQWDERQAELTREVRRLEAQKANLNRDIQDRKDTLSTAPGHDDWVAEKKALEEKVRILEDEEKRLQEVVEAGKAELAEEKTLVAAWKRQFDAKEKELDALKSTGTGKSTSTAGYKAIDDLLTENDKLLVRVAQRMAEKEKELREARLAAGHGTCTDEKHKKEVARLNLSIKTLQGQLAKANADLKACQDKSATTTTDAPSQKRIAELLKTADDLNALIKKLQDELSEMTKSRDNATNYLRSEQKNRKDMTDRLNALQVELGIAEADRDKTHARLNRCEKARQLFKKSAVERKEQLEKLETEAREQSEAEARSKRDRDDDDNGDERNPKKPKTTDDTEKPDQDHHENDEDDKGDKGDEDESDESDERESDDEFVLKNDDFVIPEAAEYPFKPTKVFPLPKDIRDEIGELNALKKVILKDVKTLDDPKLPEPILDQLRYRYRVDDEMSRNRLKALAHSRAMHEERHVFELERALEKLTAQKNPKRAEPIPTEQENSPKFNLPKRYAWVMNECDRLQLVTPIFQRQGRALNSEKMVKTIKEIKLWFESVFPAMKGRNKKGDLKQTRPFRMEVGDFIDAETRKLQVLRAELQHLKDMAAHSHEDHEAGGFYSVSEGSSAWKSDGLAILDNEGMSDYLEQIEVGSQGDNEGEESELRSQRSGKRRRIDPALQQLQEWEDNAWSSKRFAVSDQF